MMISSTNDCSNPTDDVPGGRVDHTESPWPLKITSIWFNFSEDLILDIKNRFITILADFTCRSYRKIAYLGLEFIRLWLICTKYITFLMNRTQHMYPSNPTVREALLCWLSGTPCNTRATSLCIFNNFHRN